MRLRPLTLAGLTLVFAAPLALPAANTRTAAPTAAPIADPFANPHLRASSPPLYNARVDGIDADGGNLSITDCPQGDTGGKAVCEGTAFSLKVDDPGLRTKALTFHLGDHIRIAFGPDNQVKQISGTAFASVDRTSRLLAMVLAPLLLYLFTSLAIRGNPLKLIVGMDNRYSNSKLQAAVWFWILISTYLATLFFRIFEGGMDFLGAISIPQNLLLLSGMSAISFGSAKAITQSKVNSAVAAANMAANPAANPAQLAAAAAAPVASFDPKKAKQIGEENLLNDLVMNDDGVFDFGDFQMVVVTILAVCTYLLTIYHYLAVINFTAATSLPDVDTTILAAFGLGQGAYLAKKAAGNVGGS